MAGKKQLPPVRLVGPDEVAPAPEYPIEPPTLSEAIASGSRLDELKAQRRILAAHEENPNTLARDLAALMRQSREISKEIEGLEARAAEEEAEGADDANGSADARWEPEAI